MIELVDIRKRYGPRGRKGVDALAGISLRVAPNETLAVVGPNGAGKSTLLGLVLGYLRPTAGRISVGGRTPRDWVRREGAAYLPERFSLPPDWRVASALRAFARLERLPLARSSADDVLDRFGLAPYASRPVGTLARGLLQRLGLAQALIARRQLVVFDEPTQGLDPRGRLLLRETLSGLRDRGVTVLLASHDLTEVERVADRAILLDGGRVRETYAIRPGRGSEVYAIRLASPAPELPLLFPDATRAGGDVKWLVRVTGPADLTARLAALIDSGAVVVEVAPAPATLEERVREALGDTGLNDREPDATASPGTTGGEA